MSIYPERPLNLKGLCTIPIATRGGKVHTGLFRTPYEPGSGLSAFLDSLPDLLAAGSLREVVAAIEGARRVGKPVIWGFGGHVIKCGLAPVLLDLRARNYATAFATNGAGSIHDFEIAIAGHTSEDVEAVLPDGSFGSAEETGREMNVAICRGSADGLGIGESLGRHLEEAIDAPCGDRSLLVQAYRSKTPVTVHIAYGTDTPHFHECADPAAIGTATAVDFRLFCSLAASLHEGGVYLNVGSAVVLPEVFLKAVTTVRNLGLPLRNFTTVNMDFLQHYRPKVNVVERPHAQAGGRGYSLTGHHEIMVPLLAAILAERDQP